MRDMPTATKSALLRLCYIVKGDSRLGCNPVQDRAMNSITEGEFCEGPENLHVTRRCRLKDRGISEIFYAGYADDDQIRSHSALEYFRGKKESGTE